MTRKIDWKVGSLQIAVVVTAMGFVVALVRAFHHLGDAAFTPFPSYLASIRIAFPPIILLFCSYILVFMGGISMGDVPKVVIRFLKNRFFQSPRGMMGAIAVMLIISIAIFAHTERYPSPAYERFVKILLGGEADRHTLISGELEKIETQNPQLAKQMQVVVEVYKERRKRNFEHASITSTKPRILVRALEAFPGDAAWQNHPLRKLALAESYSMLAQADKASLLRAPEDLSWKQYLDRCLKLNDEVAKSDGNRVTPLIKNSAINNSGNASLYVGEWVQAENYYRQALKANRNLTTAGNLIATLVYLNQLDEAAQLAADTREWALDNGKALLEGSQYTSILVNGAFASMINGDFQVALEFLREAHAIENDDLNALNLALGAYLSEDLTTAELALKQFRYPDLESDQQRHRVGEEYNHVYYLIKALLLFDSDPQSEATHYYTYMRRPKTKQQLESVTAESLVAIRAEVFKHLKDDPSPCRSFALIPALKERLGGEK